MSQVGYHNKIDHLIVVIARHPYVKVARNTCVIDIIDDRFMRGNLIGDRIDEELYEVVVALYKRNSLPDLDVGISRDLEEPFRRGIGI